MVFTEFDEKKFYEQTRKYYSDLGFQHGEKEGIEKSRSDVIIHMKNKGVGDEEIADLTGIPIDEVNEILRTHG